MGSEMVMGRLASTCRRLFFSILSLTRLWPSVLTEFADMQIRGVPRTANWLGPHDAFPYPIEAPLPIEELLEYLDVPNICLSP